MKERIEVWAWVRQGKTVCICPKEGKRCDRDCEECTVERDPYEGWRETMNLSRYGPSTAGV